MTKRSGLSLRRKLLVFWLASVLAIIAVIGGAYYYWYTSGLEDQATARIDRAFLNLTNDIGARKQRLLGNAEKLAKRKDIINALSIINTYQNIDDYQPLAFDPEKRKLAQELTKYASPIGLDTLFVHDTKSVLAGYYANDRATGQRSGYLSFLDGRAIPFISENAEGSFIEGGIPAVLKEQFDASMHFDKNTVLIQQRRYGILMEASAPVVRTFQNGSIKTVGEIHASYALNDEFLRGITTLTGLEFTFLMPDGARFGTLDTSFIAKSTEVLALRHDGDTDLVAQVFDSDSFIIGARQMILGSGQKIYFLFGVKKAWIATTVTAMQQAAILVVLLIVLLLFPATYFYLTATFTRPIENLLSGVQNIGDGAYKELSGFTNADELSELAEAFNIMLRSIQLRERALRDSEEKFRSFAESSSDWFWEMGSDFRFTYHSERFYQISGLEPGAMVGNKRTRYIEPNRPGEGQVEWDTHMADLAAHRAFKDFEYTFNLGNITQGSARISGAPIFDSQQNFLGYRGTGTDITKRKQVEESLISAKQELEKANLAMSRFLSTMSHELRTPLNAIIGFSDLMRSEMFEPIAPRYHGYANDIHNSGNHLLSLVNDILDMSKIEAGEYSMFIENFDLLGVLQDVTALLRVEVDMAQVSLKTDIPSQLPQLLADKRTTKQLLINLLSNAIKFTPKEGSVRVMTESGV
jgi:PAS domain S-box-containing protein